MSKFKLETPVLCLVTDPAYPRLIESVEIALTAGITMLQVRGHGLSAAQLYSLVQRLRPLCQRNGVALLINDRLDVGLAVEADGFQLGTHSLPLAVARKVVGDDYVLGISVHSVEEARTAVTNGADLLLAGTIFASHSHPGEMGQGTELLTAIKQAVPACPLLAIGGITAQNAGQVMEAGADGVAVISAILGANDIPDAVHELQSAIIRRK